MYRHIVFSKGLRQLFKLEHINAQRFCYYSAYSSEDKLYILNKINQREIPSKAVGANHVSKLLDYVEKNPLNSLEDLLNISGIGPKVLRKICDKILDARENGGSLSAAPKKKRDVHLIIPPIDTKSKAILSVVAVHVGTGSISWALVNTLQKNLIDWNFTDGLSDSGNLFNFLEMVMKITPQIPNGDLYLMEDSGYGRQRQDLHKHQFTAMLLTSLQVLRGKNNDDTVVALAKPSLKNKTYNGFVGSERVSLQNHVVDMLEERSRTDCVLVPKELKERFFRLKPAPREDMAQALLLATAFINIIINKRELNSF